MCKKQHTIKSLQSPSLSKNYLPAVAYDLIEDFKYANTAEERQVIAHRLIRVLNYHFDIINCRVRVYDKRRPKKPARKNRKEDHTWLCGLYSLSPGQKPLIELWNISETSRRLGWNQVLNVLLHEFIHHYDYKKLEVHVDHDIGFQRRLKHLRYLVFAKNKRKRGFSRKKSQ